MRKMYLVRLEQVRLIGCILQKYNVRLCKARGGQIAPLTDFEKGPFFSLRATCPGDRPSQKGF